MTAVRAAAPAPRRAPTSPTGPLAERLPPSARPVLRRACACGGTPGPTGECGECRKKRLALQRSASAAAPALAPPIVHRVLRSPGTPLDAGTRAELEPRFGHSFADVRVHADGEAAASARAVGARAYAVGPHVVFGAGRYAPGSAEGKRLMAHELAHVVQQRGAAAAIQPRLEIGGSGDPAEREAEAAAEAAVAGGDARVEHGTAPRVARAFSIPGLLWDPRAAMSPAEAAENAPPEASQADGAQPAGPGGPPAKTPPAPACPCKPPATESCARLPGKGGKGTRQDEVMAAFGTVAGWLPNADAAIQDYIGASDADKPTKKAAAPLRAHFNWPAPAGKAPLRDTPALVARVIANTTNNISQPICPNCQTTCTCSGKETWACSPGAWKKTNCYEFCDPFFAATPTQQAHVALHEMMHSWEGKTDSTYENEGAPAYPPDATSAQENADSYAGLIRDLG